MRHIVPQAGIRQTLLDGAVGVAHDHQAQALRLHAGERLGHARHHATPQHAGAAIGSKHVAQLRDHRVKLHRRQMRGRWQPLDHRDQVRAEQVRACGNNIDEQPTREARASGGLGASERLGLSRDPAGAQLGAHPVEVNRDERVADIEEHRVDVRKREGPCTHAGAWYCNREVRSAKCKVLSESAKFHFAFSISHLALLTWYGRPRCASFSSRSRRSLLQATDSRSPWCQDGRSTIGSALAATAVTDAAARWDPASSRGLPGGPMPTWRRSCETGCRPGACRVSPLQTPTCNSCSPSCGHCVRPRQTPRRACGSRRSMAPRLTASR